MSDSDLLATIRPLVAALGQLRIPYYIGGSVASSAFGRARSTMDVDMVAPVSEGHVERLVQRLGDVYYVSDIAMREAVARQSSFNVIHLETMLKVDVFVLKDRAYDVQAFERRRADSLDSDDPSATYYLASPEDVVLSKLEWYKLGGMSSERQWGDVLGVLKVQGDALDLAYCREWAPKIGVGELLEKVVGETRSEK